MDCKIIIDEIYVSILTRNGFKYSQPLKIYWNYDEEIWRDKRDLISIKKLGLSVKKDCITYSSPDICKVSSWMLGVRCCNHLHATNLLLFSTLNMDFFKNKKRKIENESDQYCKYN